MMKSRAIFRSHSDRVVGSEKMVKAHPDGGGNPTGSPLEATHHDDEGIFEDHHHPQPAQLRRNHSGSKLSEMKKRSGSRFRLLPNFMGGGGGSAHPERTHAVRSSATLEPPNSAKANQLRNQKISSASRHSSLTRAYHPNYESDIGDSAPEGDSSTPVLLAVRKRACSDSGHETNSSHNGSPGPPARPSVGIPSSRPSRGGFFRLFHKSATLLFQHPTTELNPNKPYKGSISISSKDVRSGGGGAKSRYHPRSSGAGTGSLHGHLTLHHPNQHHPSSALSAKMGGMPNARHRLQATLSASSSSSINSSVMHHHLEHDSGGGSEAHPSERGGSNTPSTSSGICSSTRQTSGEPETRRPSSSSSAQPRIHSSSSNSVISSSIEDDSNYDSGAFSRTSTPEIHPQLTSGKKSLSQIHLALAAPLSAPTLVMEACNMKRSSPSLNVLGLGQHEENPLHDSHPDEMDSVDASHILACLNAASKASTIQSPQSLPPSATPLHLQRVFPQTSKHINHHGSSSLPYYHEALDDVSITIGLNTKLTITPNPTQSSSLSHLRRTRSGLPVLGTAGLTTSSCLSLHNTSGGVAGYSLQQASPMRKPVRNTMASKGTHPHNNISTQHPNLSNVTLGRENARTTQRILGRPVSRSESCVTLCNTTILPGPACNAFEKCIVTVNGQQYTSLPPFQVRAQPSLPSSHVAMQRASNQYKNFQSLPPAVKTMASGQSDGAGIRGLIGSSIDSSSSDCDTQPNSLINI
eukprot:maker-scaffold321_size207582-snap-gene-0.11 protein:Tk05185 transcript:maker-scaffold321_size207582-snap-gene-0.11-mRNA-1 annotation:"---NA---"